MVGALDVLVPDVPGLSSAGVTALRAFSAAIVAIGAPNAAKDTFAAKKAVARAWCPRTEPIGSPTPGECRSQQVEGGEPPAKRSPSQATTSGADAVRTPKWSTPS